MNDVLFHLHGLPGFSLLSYSVDQELDSILLLFLLCRGAYHGGSPYTLGLTNVGTYKMELPGGTGCQPVSLEIFLLFL